MTDPVTALSDDLTDAVAHDTVEPPRDCPLCPRLAAFREEQRLAHPDWHNAPVPVFGDPDAWLAIVGLSPGLKGGNRSGRTFDGEKGGGTLYGTLLAFRLAHDHEALGPQEIGPEDDLVLDGVVTIDAVRCVPPNNQPTKEELRTCRPFLAGPLAALPELRVVIALGEDAHRSAVKALGGKLPKARYAPMAEHRFPSGVQLIDCAPLAQDGVAIEAAVLEAVVARALVLRSGEAAPVEDVAAP
ncbi:uracil-DNA glycosylase family protein [Sphingomonas prati]|uniref:Uracil-DNA glycosylase n=1 Tax=Sphingomonas prati TaxID=1843237 RepID=A0A7W9EZU9_9SPHN|nr:uracil-DNA glycosylase family protein [Sphingomonas prati]MBB5727651.1 uracil-DNA glycosylase [Sphingomonas prati]GGE79677.1 hypothetical protein GCM10011404_10440 [Sphingomonas prati]